MYLKSFIFKPSMHWIAAFAVFIVMMQVGIQLGWVAPNIARLTANDSLVELDNNEMSWIVSCGSLGGIAGAVLGAIAVEFTSSRITIFLALFLMALSWACMMMVNSVVWLLASRLLGGVAMSLSYSCFSIYLSEVAEPRVRGTLVSVAAGGNPLGIVVSSIAETYLPMKLTSFIYLTQCLMALLLFMWLRDSPYYLVKRGELEQARRSIEFYQPACDVDGKMEEIKGFLESHSSNRSYRDRLSDLNTSVVRRSLLIIVMLFALPHLSGVLNLSSYMGVIVKSGKSDFIKPQHFVIYANVTSVISIVFTFKLIDVLGRRALLVITSVGTTLAMAGLGTHFYLLQHGYDAANLQWLPIACILGYQVFYAFGFSSVPSTVLGELFTDNVKSTAALMATLAAPLFAFIVTKAYQPLVDLVGEPYVFWMHALLSFVTTPFALFLLPETKGKTFQEIQNSLVKQ